MINSEEIQHYWQQFQADQHITDDYYTAEQYGDGQKIGDELADLIVKGIKTATTSALELYEPNEKKPKVGTYNIVLDGSGHPACITQTKVVETINFNQVSAEHAYHEGEGDRSLAYWRAEHRKFFQAAYQAMNQTFHEQIPCICEVFTVVYVSDKK